MGQLLDRRSSTDRIRYKIFGFNAGCPALKFGKGTWAGKALLLAPNGIKFWHQVDFIPNPCH